MYSKEEAKKLRLEFWELFGKQCEVHPQLQNRKRKWLMHRTKIKGVALRFEAGRENAKVILELSHRNEELRLKAYKIPERYKTGNNSDKKLFQRLKIIGIPAF